jgi:hypothetical protein
MIEVDVEIEEAAAAATESTENLILFSTGRGAVLGSQVRFVLAALGSATIRVAEVTSAQSAGAVVTSSSLHSPSSFSSAAALPSSARFATAMRLTPTVTARPPQLTGKS